MSVTWIAVTPTVGAAAFAARDHVGDIMAFASAVTTTGTSGVVVKAQAIFTTAVAAQIDLILFTADPTAEGADNAAITVADADMLTGRGVIKLPTSEVTALNAYSFWSGYEVFECAATTLYVAAITNNVWTPAANGVTFRLGIIPTI